ncbi:MAG TPA: potassium/proton antiporter [Anaeromyxobacteraceae bacterium]|nr:potassium/proton antiporter [Anaeromyxobacteraceae bacterium]
MPTAEPLATGLFLLALGLLVGLSAAFSHASGRLGVPIALLFLGIGMLAGSEGIGGLAFDDYGLAFRAGTAALVLIIFDGGLNTPLSSLRAVVWPATALATAGVAATAGLAAVGARLLGFSWPISLLLGAVVSSTDAAAVFGTLRQGGIQIRRRVSQVLEMESGMNDPMAVILTIGLTEALTSERPSALRLLWLVVVQMVVGAAAGVAFGYLGRLALARVRLAAAGLYPVVTLAIACLTFGATTVLQGSGFLAVYVAALLIGNGPMPYQAGIRRVHDSVAWLSQVVMFLLLGLLVFPSQLRAVALPGLGLGLLLAFVARPVAVALCLAPFRFAPREVLYVGWVGLRGAVPIILATFPVLARAPGAEMIFNVVFFLVVVNTLVPGATVRRATRWLGLEAKAQPAPDATLEILSHRPVEGEILSFFIEPASAVAGTAIKDLPLPPHSSVLLVVRGHRLVPARGGTVLTPGDHVHVFCDPADKAFVQLLFGREE